MRNGYKSHRGTSAVARKAMFSGTAPESGMMPVVSVLDQNNVLRKTSYYGGPKKGGAPPNATGFMIAPGSSAATNGYPGAVRKNFYFKFRTNPGPRPWGNGPYA